VDGAICAQSKKIKVQVKSRDGRSTVLWGNRAPLTVPSGATLYTTKYACTGCHSLEYGGTPPRGVVSTAGWAPPHTGLKKRIMTQRLSPARPANSMDPADLAAAAAYIQQSIATPAAYVVYSWEPLMGTEPAIVDMSTAEQDALADWLLSITAGDDCPPLPQAPIPPANAKVMVPAQQMLSY
jgi:hypothetical protein